MKNWVLGVFWSMMVQTIKNVKLTPSSHTICRKQHYFWSSSMKVMLRPKVAQFTDSFSLSLYMNTCKVFITIWIAGDFSSDIWKQCSLSALTRITYFPYVRSHPRQSKAYSFIGKKSKGGHLSHYVICVEGCLRLQKNIDLRPINRRNTTSQQFLCKWTFIWVFCMGKQENATF